jgi:antitoxin VapB
MHTAKLFKNGQSQAVRLPKEYRIDGDHVYIKKIGNAVILLPIKNSWQTLFDGIENFSDDFMNDRNQPATQEREDF